MLLNKSLNFNFLRSEKQNGAVKSRPLSKYFFTYVSSSS